jgi:hypothetical protein
VVFKSDFYTPAQLVTAVGDALQANSPGSE